MTLADHHLAALTASGITPEHAALRGYETITEADARRLADIKIVKDLAAGAVLVAAIIAVVTGLLIFIPKII